MATFFSQTQVGLPRITVATAGAEQGPGQDGVNPSPGLPFLNVPVTAEQLGRAPYTDYKVDVDYWQDTGLVPFPVMGPPGTAPKLVRVHGGLSGRKVNWTAERMADKPTLPHWQAHEGEALLHRNVVPANPLMMPSGQNVFRASGLYSYVYASPPPESMTYFTAKTPYEVATPFQNAFPASLFDATIIATS